MSLSSRLAAMNKAAWNDGRPAALPAPLWTAILQLVPQQQRLSQCALVSRAWSRYAAEATVHVDREFKAAVVPALLGSWLAVHGSQILSVKVSAEGCDLKTLQLPLNQLTRIQRLELHGIELQLPSGEAGSNSMHQGTAMLAAGDEAGNTAGGSAQDAAAMQWPKLTSLQHLELDGVTFASINSLMQLANAPHLTSLVLSDINLTQPQYSSSSGGAAAAIDEVVDAIPCLLQQLPQLSVLHMPGFPYRDAAMQQIAALTRLQDIQLYIWPEPACDLQQLPSSLTKLQLEGRYQGSWTKGYLVPLPDLPQLTGLLDLHLDYYEVPPMVLGTLTQLQVLHLCGCFLPSVLQVSLNTAGTAAALEALRQLTSLQDLHLEFSFLNTVGIAPQHFSALTASSSLTRLILMSQANAMLPRGAVQHMFSPGRQMQALQQLTISIFHCQLNLADWCINSAGLLSITSSCPQLQRMDIAGSVQPGADLSPLLQLPQSCTSLHVGGQAFSDACMQVVLQLPQLRELSWVECPGFTDLGLEQLTALNLQVLFVDDDCGLSKHVCPDDGKLVLVSTPYLSVSQELDALCDSSPVCAPVRLKRYRELLQAGAAREENMSRQLQAAAAREEDLSRHVQAAAGREADLRIQLQDGAAREEDLRMQLQQRDAEVQQLTQQLGERGGGSRTDTM